jgi:pilus assembly protein CpaC
MKQLGVNILANTSSNGVTYSLINDNPFGLGKAISATGAAIVGDIGSTALKAYLNAMEESGVMKTLAEPSLTAVSGQKAEFRVGGEFNVLNSQTVDAGSGATTYGFDKVEYGIGLEFLPVVLSAGRISLKIRTAVSEPTAQGSAVFSGGITQPGVGILSIRKRLADTTVELPSGGSLMIAGLVQDDVRQVINGAPGLSKLPVLGTLFRSRDFLRNESELVIIVTPYLVRPVARDALARPDDNFNPPGDRAGYFLGQVNRIYGSAENKPAPGNYHGVVGYIYK